MKTIIFDTSSPYLYLAFLSEDKVIYEKFVEGKNRHSENLLQLIEEGMNKFHFALSDFNRVYLGIGPGSYTGLRVSVTVAKVLGWTLDMPVYTISSLNLLASGYLHKDGIYAITLIAKKNHVYGKLIQVSKGIIIPIIDDMYTDTETFFQIIKDYNYFLINEDNYLVNPNAIEFIPVLNLHDLSPNYLRRGV